MKTIRTILFLLLLFGTNLAAFAQQTGSAAAITDREWQDLVTALSNEKWKTATDLSAKYLKRVKEDDERTPRLRYMFLFSAAGSVIERDMTYEQLQKGLKDFVGKKIVMPYRELTLQCAGNMNYICPTKDSDHQVTTAATNSAGTSIHAFEYVQLQEKFDFARHEGEMASLGGIIQSIQFNPNKSNIWVMRLRVEKGFIKLVVPSKPIARAKPKRNRPS